MVISDCPRVIVGTERMGSVLPIARPDEQTLRHLDALLDIGCTAFDIAASYQLGGTERLFGYWMRSRRNRDRLFLVGKGAHPYPLLKPNRLTPEDLRSDLEDSLRRLATDRIDLYLVHRDSPTVAIEPILEALVGFLREGKILAYGVSNWHHDRLDALDALAKKNGVPPPAASSPQFSLVRWVRPQWPGCVSISGDPSARAYYAARKLPVLAWSPLGRGFFSGAKRDSVYDSPANASRRARAEELARKAGCTSTQVALAYLYSQPFPVHAVIWSRSVDNMRKNLEATKLRLSEDDLRWLEHGS